MRAPEQAESPGWGIGVDSRVIDDLDNVKAGVVYYKTIPKSLPIELARQHELDRKEPYPVKDSKGRIRYVKAVDVVLASDESLHPLQYEPTQSDDRHYVAAFIVDLADKPN